MICQRCGTEYENAERICPRCYYGRPKKKRKKLPKWVIPVLLVIALAAGGAFFAIEKHREKMEHYNRSDWMAGDWEGSSLAVNFNTEDETFMLHNGDTHISGTYVVSEDSFTFTDTDGMIYVYRYERKGDNKVELSFTEDGEVVRVVLERIVYEEFEDLEEFAE